MPIPVSTVPAVKAALLAGVTALVNDPGVTVCYDDPGPELTDDIIMIGRVDREVLMGGIVGGGGAGWLDEKYTIEVIVSVYRGGDDPKTVFERGCALADVVVAFVRADPSIGGLVVVAHPSHWVYDPQWEAEHKGRIATVIGHIAVTTRI